MMEEHNNLSQVSSDVSIAACRVLDGIRYSGYCCYHETSLPLRYYEAREEQHVPDL